MIRIFDVFHHQLPIARNALTVVTQQGELSAFEDAVYPGHHIWAKIVLQRFGFVAERRKHQTIQHGNPQLGQAVVFHIKIVGHAAIDAVALFHAVFKRQASQIAVEFVSPLVIGAHKAAGIALRGLAEAHAAVRAAVFDHTDAVVRRTVFGGDAVAHHEHLPLAHMAKLEVAKVGDLNLQPDITPVRTVKNLFQLTLVKLGVGVSPKGHAAGAGLAPAGCLSDSC